MATNSEPYCSKMYQPEIDRNKVIIEDWVDSDDEETDVTESQKETVFNTENSEESFKNRTRVPQAATFHRSIDGSYNPRKINEDLESAVTHHYRGLLTPRTTLRDNKDPKNCEIYLGKKGITVGSQAVLSTNWSKKECNGINPKQTWKPKGNYHRFWQSEEDLKNYAIIDSGCSGSMTGDKNKLSDFKEFKGGYVAFWKITSKGGRISSGKGTQ
ncbi:hypothetical protein Tco_0251797 [Tanacetum coccineum]